MKCAILLSIFSVAICGPLVPMTMDQNASQPALALVQESTDTDATLVTCTVTITDGVKAVLETKDFVVSSKSSRYQFWSINEKSKDGISGVLLSDGCRQVVVGDEDDGCQKVSYGDNVELDKSCRDLSDCPTINSGSGWDVQRDSCGIWVWGAEGVSDSGGSATCAVYTCPPGKSNEGKNADSTDYTESNCCRTFWIPELNGYRACNGNDGGCQLNLVEGDGDCDEDSNCQSFSCGENNWFEKRGLDCPQLACGENNCQAFHDSRLWPNSDATNWDLGDDCCYRVDAKDGEERYGAPGTFEEK